MAKIQFRRGVAANLPVLSAGEPGFTTDNYKFYIGDGATNHEIGGGGGGGLAWKTITASQTGVAGEGYLIRSSANVTITLPATPTDGDEIGFADENNKATTYTLTLARNGKLIESIASDLIIDTDGSGFSLVYSATNGNWKIVSEITTAAGASGIVQLQAWNFA